MLIIFSLKYGKVVILTSGRYAGSKAIVIKVNEDGLSVIFNVAPLLNIYRIRNSQISLSLVLADIQEKLPKNIMLKRFKRESDK